MTWQVEVDGEPWDIDYLMEITQGGPQRILLDPRGVGYLYESDSLNALMTSAEVVITARDELRVLSGILKLERGVSVLMQPGAVSRVAHDGGRDTFLRHRSSGPRVLFGSPTELQSGPVSDAPPLNATPPRAATILQVSARDTAVSKVLRLLSDPDAASWVGLYRIHEVIEADVGGQHSMQKMGWVSSEDLKRFKHSANSVQVGGDAARHGKEQHLPPKNPLTLSEAASYLTYVLHTWLASKSA